MNYLLDTQYLLWSATDTKKISATVKHVITSPENSIIVSTVSFWEISLKFSLGKLKLEGCTPEDITDACSKMGFEIVALSKEESSTYHYLTATHHKDPFDRMLIWQAIRNSFTLITNDQDVIKYKSAGLNVLV